MVIIEVKTQKSVTNFGFKMKLLKFLGNQPSYRLKKQNFNEKQKIRIRKDLMTEQNFDSKTIRYLYVSMIIAGLAFTGKLKGQVT